MEKERFYIEVEQGLSLTCKTVLVPINDALYVIGGKWKLLVIGALRSGSKRFNEVRRALNGISARVLSNELKDLELNGIVLRVVKEDTNLVVEYHLTDYAAQLDNVLLSLANWGSMHRNKLRQEG